MPWVLLQCAASCEASSPSCKYLISCQCMPNIQRYTRIFGAATMPNTGTCGLSKRFGLGTCNTLEICPGTRDLQISSASSEDINGIKLTKALGIYLPVDQRGFIAPFWRGFQVVKAIQLSFKMNGKWIWGMQSPLAIPARYLQDCSPQQASLLWTMLCIREQEALTRCLMLGFRNIIVTLVPQWFPSKRLLHMGHSSLEELPFLGKRYCMPYMGTGSMHSRCRLPCRHHHPQLEHV